ncbi:MAG TPA: hypothetical protein EYQ50_22490 [Verrucomicrobiales bacterium]|nr:hypothetical protein [Verrucomicrobiales bacterium]
MMPEGLLSTFQPDEIRDLIAYLEQTEQVPLPGAAPEMNTSTGRVPGALEGESLKVINSKGSVSNQLMSGFSKGKWSGNDQLWWHGGKPGDRIELNTPVGREGRYAVFISLTKARDYGIFRITLNGEEISKNIDLFNEPDVITTGVIFLGEHHLKAGDHVLGVELIGANPKAVQSYMFGLDWVKFSLVPES